jgi:hypothetical protein
MRHAPMLSWMDPPTLSLAAEPTSLRCASGPVGGATSRWGVVQPVGHLTVNEDGEGSNPSAPANFLP